MPVLTSHGACTTSKKLKTKRSVQILPKSAGRLTVIYFVLNLLTTLPLFNHAGINSIASNFIHFVFSQFALFLAGHFFCKKITKKLKHC